MALNMQESLSGFQFAELIPYPYFGLKAEKYWHPSQMIVAMWGACYDVDVRVRIICYTLLNAS